VPAQADTERDLLRRRVQHPQRTAQRGGGLGGLLLDGGHPGPDRRVELGLLAQPADAGPDGEEHRPDGVVQLQGEPAALLVHGDLGRVLGPFGDDLGGGRPDRNALQRLRGAVAELGIAPVGTVEHAEQLAVVDDRDGDHRPDLLGLRPGGEQ
jgi:hypothetical protein